jgi:hypothetical protein
MNPWSIVVCIFIGIGIGVGVGAIWAGHVYERKLDDAYAQLYRFSRMDHPTWREEA